MEMKSKIDCVCEVFDTMLSCFKSEISNGLFNVDTKEAGEVADIIKDMSETEKNLREANYYKLVSEAMEENEKMGYTSTFKPKVDQKPYIDAYLHDPDFERSMRRGYVDFDGRSSENGMAYDNYRDAKRHYTETKSATDKSKMDIYADEHLANSIKTIKEIWADADPTRKARMKVELAEVVNGMAI